MQTQTQTHMILLINKQKSSSALHLFTKIHKTKQTSLRKMLIYNQGVGARAGAGTGTDFNYTSKAELKLFFGGLILNSSKNNVYFTRPFFSHFSIKKFFNSQTAKEFAIFSTDLEEKQDTNLIRLQNATAIFQC